MVSARESALSVQSWEDLRVACYCEENVWRLVMRMSSVEGDIRNNSKSTESSQTISAKLSCKVVKAGASAKRRGSWTKSRGDVSQCQCDHHDDSLGYVVFITNDVECCPMLYQRIGRPENRFLVSWDYHVIYLNNSKVYDLDSKLEFPCDATSYFNQTFDYEISGSFSPKFKVIRAKDYLLHFMSDRSHMIDSSGNHYTSPPPYYDTISSPMCSCGRTWDLVSCRNMKSGFVGLMDFFSTKK